MSHELTGISVEVASGASLKRPALQSVLEYLPTIDGIIVLKLDRLSRSLKDTVNIRLGISTRRKIQQIIQLLSK